jgi:hypothetical protein
MINIHTILYYILQILVMDRSWMYDRYYPGNRGQIKEIFKLGVELFIKAVKQGVLVQFANVDVFVAKTKLNIIYIPKDSNPIIGFGQVMVNHFSQPRLMLLIILVT